MPDRTQGGVKGGAFPGRGRAWQPLLDGAGRQRALEAVQAIADSLRAGCPAGTAPAAAVGPSLAGGAAGLALFFAYLAESRGGAEDEAAARHWLDQAIAAVSEVEVPASLYSGLTGVAWVAAHLGVHFPDLDTEAVCQEIDEALLSHLSGSPWPGSYDLIDGLVGLGVYAQSFQGQRLLRSPISCEVATCSPCL